MNVHIPLYLCSFILHFRMLTASKCMQMILAVLLAYVVSAYAYHPDLAYMRTRFPFQMHRLNDRSIDEQGTSSDPAAPVRKDGKSKIFSIQNSVSLLSSLNFSEIYNIPGTNCRKFIAVEIFTKTLVCGSYKRFN